MSDPVRKLFKNVCSDISQETLTDLNSKKIKLLDHTVLLVKSVMRNEELTDMAMGSGISRSQLSKLDAMRPYQVFVEMFYSLLYPYIMSHNYTIYSRFLNVIGIDSTFIRTRIKESGKYGRQKTENGIKMHSSAMFVAVNDSMTICSFCSTVNFSGMCITCSMGMVQEICNTTSGLPLIYH